MCVCVCVFKGVNKQKILSDFAYEKEGEFLGPSVKSVLGGTERWGRLRTGHMVKNQNTT